MEKIPQKTLNQIDEIINEYQATITYLKNRLTQQNNINDKEILKLGAQIDAYQRFIYIIQSLK